MKEEIIPTLGLEKDFMVIRCSEAINHFEPKKDSFRLANGAFIVGLKGTMTLSMNLTQYEITANTNEHKVNTVKTLYSFQPHISKW